MKRKVIAVILGTALALPALANERIINNEIDPGNLPPSVASTKTREQVRAELEQAYRSGERIVDAEQGLRQKPAAQSAGKTREQVRAELRAARAAGEFSDNAEM